MPDDISALAKKIDEGFTGINNRLKNVSDEQHSQRRRLDELERTKGGLEERARAAMQSASDLRNEVHELKDAFARATPQEITAKLDNTKSSVDVIGAQNVTQTQILHRQNLVAPILALLTALVTAGASTAGAYWATHPARDAAHSAAVSAASAAAAAASVASTSR